jgi:hypothetical protein
MDTFNPEMPEVGGQISRSGFLDPLVEQVKALRAEVEALRDLIGNDGSRFDMIELNEDIGVHTEDAAGDSIYYDQSVSSGSDHWKDSGVDYQDIADIDGFPRLDQERHLTFWHSFGGMRAIFGTSIQIGKLDGALSQGGSATMSLWEWDGSTFSDSGTNCTVYDFLLAAGQSIASGKKVVAFGHKQSRYMIVLAAECA